MAPDQFPSALRIPCYKLYYLTEVTDTPLSSKELHNFYTDYGPSQRQEIVQSLEWAVEHPDFPFSSVLPELPFSDAVAYRYLVNLLRQLNEYDATEKVPGTDY